MKHHIQCFLGENLYETNMLDLYLSAKQTLFHSFSITRLLLKDPSACLLSVLHAERRNKHHPLHSGVEGWGTHIVKLPDEN